jgi:hypothetical protein
MYDAWIGPRIVIGIEDHGIVEQLIISVLVEKQHPQQKQIEVIAYCSQ